MLGPGRVLLRDVSGYCGLQVDEQVEDGAFFSCSESACRCRGREQLVVKWKVPRRFYSSQVRTSISVLVVLISSLDP